MLLSLLTPDTTSREEYARRRGLSVETPSSHEAPVTWTDGLNTGVPVSDEAAALMRLASQGSTVSPSGRFTVLPDGDAHVRFTSGATRAARLTTDRTARAWSRDGPPVGNQQFVARPQSGDTITWGRSSRMTSSNGSSTSTDRGRPFTESVSRAALGRACACTAAGLGCAVAAYAPRSPHRRRRAEPRR